MVETKPLNKADILRIGETRRIGYGEIIALINIMNLYVLAAYILAKVTYTQNKMSNNNEKL